jgi:hypothetical protein
MIGYLQMAKTTEAWRMGGAEKLSLKDLLRRSKKTQAMRGGCKLTVRRVVLHDSND